MLSNNNIRDEGRICPVCNEPLQKVEHFEYDGVTEYGSYEPYYDCKNNCDIDTEESEIV